MLWNKILMVYDGTEGSLRATEYVAKMLGKTEGVKVMIFGVHEKIPRHDLKDTSPVVDKLQKQLTSMQLEIERGQARIQESKALLARAGMDEKAITVKYVERKQSSAIKEIVSEAEQGGYGTLVIGRSEEKSYMFAGGNLAKDLTSDLKDRTLIIV